MVGGMRGKMEERGRQGPRYQKRLGQHHLRQGALCTPLIEFLRPANRQVFEIGPGGGVLTRELLAAGAAVTAVELDLAWGLGLAQMRGMSGIRLIVGDAMKIEWRHLPERSLVAGNLPFQIGTALIELLLPLGDRLSRAGFLVQKEVAERLLAAPGEAAYGALSVLTAAYAEVRLLGRVASGSFRPPPRVEATFIGLSFRIPPLPADEMGHLAAVVRLAFGQRRKRVRNALAAGWGRREADRVLAEAGVDGGQRAQQMTLEQFVAVTRTRPRRGD